MVDDSQQPQITATVDVCRIALDRNIIVENYKVTTCEME